MFHFLLGVYTHCCWIVSWISDSNLVENILKDHSVDFIPQVTEGVELMILA